MRRTLYAIAERTMHRTLLWGSLFLLAWSLGVIAYAWHPEGSL
jgi:hypothetical protein